MHGQLTIDLGSILYSDLLSACDDGSPCLSFHSLTPSSSPSSSIPSPPSISIFGMLTPLHYITSSHTYFTIFSPPSIPLPLGPSFSILTYHHSVPAPLHQTWSSPLQPTHAPFGIPHMVPLSNPPLVPLCNPLLVPLSKPHLLPLSNDYYCLSARPC